MIIESEIEISFTVYTCTNFKLIKWKVQKPIRPLFSDNKQEQKLKLKTKTNPYSLKLSNLYKNSYGEYTHWVSLKIFLIMD